MGADVASPARAGAAVKLDVRDLLERARQATGLTDFGDTWFLGPLEQLVAMINAESGLVSADAQPVQGLVGNLADRLRLTEYLRRHPAAAEEQVNVAGVIIGWPRGGSTLLHRLLASSPQLTAPAWWELLLPLPLDGEAAGQPQPRITAANQAVDALYERWPKLRAMHPVIAEAVDEEVMLMDRSFMSLMYPQYFYVPSYLPWLRRQDHRPLYEDVMLWLRVLQHQRPERRDRRWILKSPQHLLGGGLHTALEMFPEARAIITHRPLENIITSYCSMQTVTMDGYSTAMDPQKLGPQAIEVFRDSLKQLLAIRAAGQDHRFIDVRFQATVEDPIGVFRSTMQQLGLTVGPEDEAAARSWMAANGRENHPPHHYKPEDYGMTREQLQEEFRFYREAFLA
jgi:hypothetical protein